MGFFSYRSIVSGHDIFNNNVQDDLNQGIAMLLPDGRLLVGDYDGYGRIENKDGVHDIYDVVAEMMFGVADRDLIFANKKFITNPYGEVSIVDKFRQDEPILVEDFVGDSDHSILGKSFNELRKLGYVIETNYDRAGKYIKVMLRTEVDEHLESGKTFDDYEPSKNAEGQGFWLSSYETRV
jgi:hypothetical protein